MRGEGRGRGWARGAERVGSRGGGAEDGRGSWANRNPLPFDRFLVHDSVHKMSGDSGEHRESDLPRPQRQRVRMLVFGVVFYNVLATTKTRVPHSCVSSPWQLK